MSLATQRQDASNAQHMLAPRQSFPLERVLSSDVNPGTNADTPPSHPSSTQATTSSAAYTSHASPHKLSDGAIVGIVIGEIIVAILLGFPFFLLGRQKTMLQFMRRDQYQALGAQNPPKDQPDIRSPRSQMTAFPTASAMSDRKHPITANLLMTLLRTQGTQSKVLWPIHSP